MRTLVALALTVADPVTGEQRFARIKVPPILPRLVEVKRRLYVPLEQVIAANLDALFPGVEVVEAHMFRVTRDADFDVEEDEAGDLLSAIEQELRRRRFGSAVRLEVEEAMPASMREFLLSGIGLSADDLVALIRREDARISRATVYRTLQWMVDAGVARKVDFGEGRFRFEHSYRHPRHFHLICSRCHRS